MTWCKSEHIILELDGDDGLAGTQVLKLYNNFYHTTGGYVVYGNYLGCTFGEQIGASDYIDP